MASHSMSIDVEVAVFRLLRWRSARIMALLLQWLVHHGLLFTEGLWHDRDKLKPCQIGARSLIEVGRY